MQLIVDNTKDFKIVDEVAHNAADFITESGYTAYMFNSELGEGFDYYIVNPNDDQVDSGHRTTQTAILRQLRLVATLYRETI
jgi:hypothetical protein